MSFRSDLLHTMSIHAGTMVGVCTGATPMTDTVQPRGITLSVSATKLYLDQVE